MTLTFADVSRDRGLIHNPNRGEWLYKDKFSKVAYRHLKTFETIDDKEDYLRAFQVPHLAVFTTGPEDQDFNYRFCGIISRIYQFLGNEDYVNEVKESLSSGQAKITEEYFMMNSFRTKFRYSASISNSISTTIGDVLPTIVLKNSYDASWARIMQFGLKMADTLFAFNMGKFRQVHVSGASTRLVSDVDKYVSKFEEGITELIDTCSKTKISNEKLMSVLELLEEMGKRRHSKIVEILNRTKEEKNIPNDELPDIWTVFTAFVNYNKVERNLNAIDMIEDVAQSVLIIPTKLMEVFQNT